MQLQEYLSEHSVKFDVLEHDNAFDAQHLAQAVHVPGRNVAKTVMLRVDHGYRYAVAVVPASHMVDLPAIERMLGGAHVELATEAEVAEHCPDCECGSLPPFGSMYGMDTLLDASLRQSEQLVFGGNTHREAIRMGVDDFVRLEQPLVGEIAVWR